MNEMNSITFYRSFFEAIKKLNDDQRLKLYDAIFEYQFEQKNIEFDDAILQSFWILIQPNIDASNSKKLAGAKGGRPKKNKQKASFSKNKNLAFQKSKSKEEGEVEEEVEVEKEVEVEVEDNIIPPSEQSSSGSVTAKASKHKYGEYKNVLLKDEELQALQRDYSNWEELIKYLDEYIEMKGYKAKSHYLCIKKWVVKAVNEKKHDGKPKEVPTNNPFLRILANMEDEENGKKGDSSNYGSNENVVSTILSDYTVE